LLEVDVDTTRMSGGTSKARSDSTYAARAPDFSLPAYLKDVLERPVPTTTLVDVRSPVIAYCRIGERSSHT
jgi:hypothetical protein